MNRFRALGVFLLGLSACRAEPEAIVAGSDYCGHCRMEIADVRFGGEVLTEKGRALKFDSLFCLKSYLSETKQKTSRVFVLDFLHPGTLISLEQARFLRSDQLKGPMGPGVIASRDDAGLKKLRAAINGKEIRWEQISSY